MPKETERRSSSVGDHDLEHMGERLIASARKFAAAAGKARAAYDTWPQATQEKFRQILSIDDSTNDQTSLARRLLLQMIFGSANFRSIADEQQLVRYGSKPVAVLFTDELCAELGFSRPVRTRLLNALSDRWWSGEIATVRALCETTEGELLSPTESD